MTLLLLSGTSFADRSSGLTDSDLHIGAEGKNNLYVDFNTTLKSTSDILRQKKRAALQKQRQARIENAKKLGISDRNAERLRRAIEKAKKRRAK